MYRYLQSAKFHTNKEETNMAWTQEKINETYAQMQKLAATDEAFRAELLSDANTAIAKVAGGALPEGYNIKVVEHDPAYSSTIVLAPVHYDELDDSTLEGVAGGNGIVTANPFWLLSRRNKPSEIKVHHTYKADEL